MLETPSGVWVFFSCVISSDALYAISNSSICSVSSAVIAFVCDVTSPPLPSFTTCGSTSLVGILGVEEILLLGDALKLMDKWLDTTHRQTERPDGTRTDE